MCVFEIIYVYNTYVCVLNEADLSSSGLCLQITDQKFCLF